MTSSLLIRIVLAVIIAVVVGLLLQALLGPVLVSLKVPIATQVGEFFVHYGFVLGVLVGLWYLLTGGTWFRST